MKFKLLSATDAKKKLGTFIVCGALVAVLGTASAFAANSIASLQIKYENGLKLYSTDGGKTWSKQAPEGITESVGADGKVTSSRGTPPREGEGGGLLTKVEDGVKSYSTDGGKTWGEQSPEQAGAKGDDANKSLHTYKRGVPDGAETNLTIKIENGVKLYSTDGGKSWSKQAPEGVTETADADGKMTTTFGSGPKEGEGHGTLSKVEDGVRTYSTDGGKTWSEQAPDEAEESSTIGY
ncbi:sialidase family protein [Paenibacillus sp. GYB003]|uniref:sialidase family protein n=1 Tax=Paenibacillus sp. GYB003 TaxID=2994392 RepID=UPI002F96B814